MGAMCGKPEGDDGSAGPAASRPVAAPAATPQQQPPAAASNGHAASSSAAASSSGAAAQPATTQQPYQASSQQSSVVDHEKDVQVQVGGTEPEFNAADAEKQADGAEAYSYWNRNKTFKPERQLPQGSKASQLQHTMQATMKATLGGGELQNTVKLPEGEDLNEWIAVNTVHFFNAASMIYGTCTQFCTEQSCPTMSAGKAEYLWKDGLTYKKPTRVSAPVYVDFALTLADERISNPALFPVEQNAKFPRHFLAEVKQIYKRLFRIYAHIYTTHSEKIRSIGANAHLNTCFKHFIYFVLEFNLIPHEEMQPLEKLIAKLREAKAKK